MQGSKGLGRVSGYRTQPRVVINFVRPKTSWKSVFLKAVMLKVSVGMKLNRSNLILFCRCVGKGVRSRCLRSETGITSRNLEIASSSFGYNKYLNLFKPKISIYYLWRTYQGLKQLTLRRCLLFFLKFSGLFSETRQRAFHLTSNPRQLHPVRKVFL